MKKIHTQIHWLPLLLFLLASCNGLINTDQSSQNEGIIKSEFNHTSAAAIIDTIATHSAPRSITRTIIQDQSGIIWLATFEGIFKYDGRLFSNVSRDISRSRFFSAFEDSKGNLWFGSIGEGVYLHDGKSFQNFTTIDGLLSNEVVCIYEDKTGNIWFGTNGGASLYGARPRNEDGQRKFFKNFIIKGDTIREANIGVSIPNLQRPINEVNSIVEDSSGKLWLGTRGNTFIYDGKSFATVSHNGETFTNARWIINDKKENIWLGGKDGLWRYDGITFHNITEDFVGYIYEDKTGNIWTSSQSTYDGKWMLSRYDEKSLSNSKPAVTEIKSEYEGNKGMMFGILEANDGSIWFGALDGAHRYDGHTITRFDDKVNQE